MQQLQTYRFYELGAKLHQLFCCGMQNRVADMFASLTEAQTILDGFIKGDVFALETSKADATRLLNKIGALFNRYFIDPATKQLKPVTGEDRVDPNEMALISALVEKFEHALAAELSRTPTYVANKRGIYSVYDLAEHAEQMFSDTLRASIPTQAQEEFAMAGRALAFGLGTAAVVHLLRSVEVTLKNYYEVISGTALARNERTYTIYLKKLATLIEEDDKAKAPDRRVLQMLTQIKDHYRNPLISAENASNLDEAMQLFGLASALIGLMAEQVATRGKKMVSEDKNQAKSAVSALSDVAGDDTEVYDYPLSQAG